MLEGYLNQLHNTFFLNILYLYWEIKKNLKVGFIKEKEGRQIHPRGFMTIFASVNNGPLVSPFIKKPMEFE